MLPTYHIAMAQIADVGIRLLCASARSGHLRPDTSIELTNTMSATRSYSEHERPHSSMDQAMQSLQHKTSYKRKRTSPDPNGNKNKTNQRPLSASNNVHGNGHAPDSSHNLFPNESSSNDFTAIGQQLAQHNANANTTTAAAALAANMPQLTVPRPTELSFPSSGSGTDADRYMDSSFDMAGGSDGDHHQHRHTQGTPYNLDAYQGDGNVPAQSSDGGGGAKPAVGTDEWHKVRRDNHKEG